MFDTIMESMRGGLLFWSCLTGANALLIARIVLALLDKVHQRKAVRKWAEWKRRYEPGA